MKILVTRTIPAEGIDILKSFGASLVVNPHQRSMTQNELADAVTDVDGLLGMLSDTIDAPLIDRAPLLKVISNYAVGYDNIDLVAAKRRGIVVTNTPDVLTEATADLTFALILACARRVAEADACLRNNGFRGWSPLFMLGTEVHGKTLGIVGAGRIGRAVARRAAGFSMPVFYAAHGTNAGGDRMPIDDLLRRSDFVSLHCPMTEKNFHMIGARELARMKPSAILINTARGKLIDENALVDALGRGIIAGAGLDVYENEPVVHPALLPMTNVVLLPHIGSASRETRERMAVIAAESLVAVLRGGEPRYRVI